MHCVILWPAGSMHAGVNGISGEVVGSVVGAVRFSSLSRRRMRRND